MKKITNQKEFITWITEYNLEFKKNEYNRNKYLVENTLYIKGMELTGLLIENKSFIYTKFENCIFEDCHIKSSIFQSCTFENCLFKNSYFFWSKFLECDLFNSEFKSCTIADLDFVDLEIDNSYFINCSEIIDLRIRGFGNRNIYFNNSYLFHLDIEPVKGNYKEKIKFNECFIKESNFNRIKFTEKSFENCNLSLNQFSSCELSKDSFIKKNKIPAKEFNLIDIRTILNSPTIEESILENIFGIHNSEIKEYLIDLTSKIEFQSIFISYSFKDKNFAKNIDETLRRRGVLTFLWENDSPGGKTLKSIMSTNVKEKDRVLFIASKDSLKSKACHYELSQGRQKQELIWEDVLFPIHIDNYLFELEKSKIRPEDVQEEYWSNIEELRKLNSLDFSQFVNSKERDEREFEKLIFRLIKGLRKEK